MKKAYIVVYQEDPYNTMYDVLFGDLIGKENVYFLKEKKFPQKGFYRYLPSRKLKRASFGLSNRLYLSYYNLPRKIHELQRDYDHISVLMFNASLNQTGYPIELFDLLKQHASFNLIYLDVHDHDWVCKHANYLLENKAFDKVFSVDPRDAEQYGLVLCNTPYSRVVLTESTETDTQLYFCGAEARRMTYLHPIWEEARKRGVHIEYDLKSSDRFKALFEKDPNVRFIDHLPYSEVLCRTLQSSCILDITQKNQTALTIRPYEAVVYNRKLLTNNRSILNFKYFDSRFMQFFHEVEDIDWDWLCEKTIVDYGYKGDFSPLKLLEQLE